MKFLQFIVLFVSILPLIYSRRGTFFRKDYTYVEEYDAFYKMHWDTSGLSLDSAFLSCNDEGAILFHPKNEEEKLLLDLLMRNLKETPNVTDMFVGLHDKFNVGEITTIEGQPTLFPLSLVDPDDAVSFLSGNCVTMNIYSGTYDVGPCIRRDNEPLLFVCKKVNDELCPTIDLGYKYIKSSNKCYKINKRQKKWDEAMRTCYLEGGILVVLENDKQAEALRQFVDSKIPNLYHAGFRKIVSAGDYYSVKGEILDDVYHNYNSDEINSDSDSYQKCGAYNFYYGNDNIRTVTTNCEDKRPFICEMDTKPN